MYENYKHISILLTTLDNKINSYNDINYTKINTYDKLYSYLQLDNIYHNNKNIKIIHNNIIITSNNYYKKFYKYIINSNASVINLELKHNINGGFIMDVINAVINIFKLLISIPKAILFILRFILWLIKFLIYIIALLFSILDTNGLLGLIKFIAREVLLAPINFIFIYAKKFVNNIGNLTFMALAGVDNVKDDSEEPTEFHNDKCYEEKCYRTGNGLVPFSVIIMTILCPPLGVFMEYGITGWFNIIICILLTIAFYFPGLLYALILLYC